MNRRMLRLIALVVTAALLVAACGDDDDTDTTDDAGASEDSADSPDLNGDPLLIGFINQEDGDTTFPDLHDGAEAARKHINATGGINGRPLEFEVCTTNGSPEASQACANDMIEAGVPVVNAGIDFGSGQSIPVLGQAEIPYIPTLPTNFPDEYTAPNVYTFFGGTAGQYIGQVNYILDEYEPDTVGVIVINVPQGTDAADQMVKTPMEAAGVTVSVVPANPTDDFATAVTSVMRSDPDVVMVMFTGPPCGLIMQAVGSQAVDVPVLYPSGCIDKDYLAAGGGGADGSIFSVESLLPAVDPSEEEVSLYLEAMEEHAGIEADDLTTYHQVSFVSTYNLAEALRRIEGDVSPQSVVEALTTGGPHASLMTPDYDCTAEALPGMPFTTLCGAPVRFVEHDGGEFSYISDWR